MVSIIIPLFNRLEYTRQCLGALARCTPGKLYEVILVDNGSTDGTGEFLGCLGGSFRIVRNENNLGFARACNQGANAARGKYLLFLNNDTLPQEGWLEALLQPAEGNPSVGVVGARLLYPDGTIQHAGVVIGDSPHPLFPFHVHTRKPADMPEANVLKEFQAVTGACMLVSRDVFLRLGGFDEGFLNGYEDVDLCFRVREAGFAVIYNPASVLVHHESASEGRFAALEQNVRLLHDKWLGKIHADFIATKEVRRLTSIVILAHNQLDYTKHCVESVFRHTPEPFELIVVDNGSTDGTGDYLEGRKRDAENRFGDRPGEGHSACRRLEILSFGENLGFAEGNNRGIDTARGDYILMLNNDAVVTPGWLGKLIACAESKPTVGIVGPMTNRISGPQQVAQAHYDTRTLEGLESFSGAFSSRNAGRRVPFWRIVGFCMLIKRAVIDRIGGLDPRFGLGNFEDDDFCIRAHLAGFESQIAGDCFVHHFGGRTFDAAGTHYHEALRRNWEIFKDKWGVPREVALGEIFDMSELLREGFQPERHFIPLGSPQGAAIPVSSRQGKPAGSRRSVDGPLLIVQVEPPQNEDGGDFYYRTHTPGIAMAAQEGVFVIALSNIHRRKEKIMRAADVLILKDVCDPDLLPVIAERKAQGRLTVYELDDDIAAIPPWSPVHFFYRAPENLALSKRLMHACDALQFSVEELKRLYGHLNPATAVFVNHISIIPPERAPDRENGIVIGWGGSHGHLEDMAAIAPALAEWILAKENVSLNLMCSDPIWELFSTLPENRRRRFRPGSVEDYYAFLQTLDIGIAPLSESPFNRSRSDVKFLEYAVTGVAAVVQNRDPYRGSVRDKETGILFDDPVGLVASLEQLCRDRPLRLRIAAQAREYVLRQRLQGDRGAERTQFYRQRLRSSGGSLNTGAADFFTEASGLEGASLQGRHARLRPTRFEQLIHDGLVLGQIDGDSGRARACFSEAARLEPANYLPHLYGSLAAADPARSLEEAFRRNPRSLKALVLLGEALAGRGKAADALKSFEKAAGLYPAYEVPYLRAAVLLKALGRREDASALEEKARALMLQ